MYKAKKKKLTPLPKLLKKAEKVFNGWIRKRDSEDGVFFCVSCGECKNVLMMNAGHYVPVSRCSFLRFHEDNCNGECAGCNCFDEGHLIGYRTNLVKKIGEQRVVWLEENRHKEKRWTRSELEEIIKKYS